MKKNHSKKQYFYTNLKKTSTTNILVQLILKDTKRKDSV